MILRFSVALFVLSAATAHADVIPACAPPSGVRVHAFTDLPAGLKQALEAKLGDMALPGQPFDATDVVTSAHPVFRRGIFVWSRGTRWIVATEHGGIAYDDPVLAYDVDADGIASLVAVRGAVPNTVCVTAKGLLDAKRP